jgi:hypothetical protein
MIRFSIVIASILFILSACNERTRKAGQEDHSEGSPFLFRMHMVFTDAEKFVSFPIWFDDSLIVQNKISKITRSIYFIDIDDTMEMGDLSKDIPREKKEYWFHPNGQMKQLKVTYFYDDEEIGHIAYWYTSMKDKYGFATVLKSEGNDTLEVEEDVATEFPFRTHQKAKQTDKYLAYQDDESGDYLFYMLNKKYWGPLSIDSILSPTPKDIVVLGSPYFPTKQYSVENKVNEKNIVQVKYDQKTKAVKTIIRQEYPFDQRRTLSYTKKGVCNGYIDSTFSGELFLTRTLTDIETDKKNKPLRIVHRKENQHNRTGRVSIELFTYE